MHHGVSGTVARMIKMPDGTLRILVHGTHRVRLKDYVATEPYLVGREKVREFARAGARPFLTWYGADAARGPFVRPLREDKDTKAKGAATKD